MYERISGRAVFRSLEDWVEVALSCDPTGRIEVAGWVQDGGGIGNRLAFGFELGQTFLLEILRQLDTVLEHFLVVGERD